MSSNANGLHHDATELQSPTLKVRGEFLEGSEFFLGVLLAGENVRMSKPTMSSGVCQTGAPPAGGRRCLSAGAKQHGRLYTELMDTLVDIFEKKNQLWQLLNVSPTPWKLIYPDAAANRSRPTLTLTPNIRHQPPQLLSPPHTLIMRPNHACLRLLIYVQCAVTSCSGFVTTNW